MMHTTIFKASISAALLLGGLTACKASVNAEDMEPTILYNEVDVTSKLPPVRKALDCLPTNAAMIAAHRATDKSRADMPENALSGLEALIAHGTKMAEIDVAGTKDGVLFSYHDGVWDELSTGKGPVAATTAAELDTILLKTRAGELTAERPPLFTDMLNRVKGKMYLEIDFKSSADPEAVVEAIRAADMADQVLLIAYNPAQAAELERLAPEMLRSNPVAATQKNHGVWLGYDVANDDTAKLLKMNENYIIGRIGDPKRQPPLNELIAAAHILVSDYAFRQDGIIGMTDDQRPDYEACLTN